MDAVALVSDPFLNKMMLWSMKDRAAQILILSSAIL